MGMLLIVEGTRTYPVRYHTEYPTRTVQRLPAPATEADLVQFLGRELGMASGTVQRLVADVGRWGAVSIAFDLPDDCAHFFVPFQPRAV
jgi:hypothetical protein